MPEEATTDSAVEAGSTAAATQTAAPTERTYTQSELDTIVAERVNKSKAQYKDYADFKAKAGEAATLATQLQTLQGEKASIESDFTLAARDAQMLKVAIDKGVPADMVDRLKGNTIEELEADADTLMSALGSRTQQFGGFNGGTAPGATVNTPKSVDDAVRAALLR